MEKETNAYLIIKMCKTRGFGHETVEQDGDRKDATGNASGLP